MGPVGVIQNWNIVVVFSVMCGCFSLDNLLGCDLNYRRENLISIFYKLRIILKKICCTKIYLQSQK